MYRKELEFVSVQVFCKRISCLYEHLEALVGEMLQCRHEPSNEVDENAIAIIRTDSLRKESTVGHVPQNIIQKYTYYLESAKHLHYC